MAGSGMDHHSLRLIDHQNVTVLIKDIEGNIFRQDIRFHGRRDFDLDFILFPEPVIGLQGLSSQSHHAFFQKFLNIRTGELGKLS